jgi:high-affinity Fe2+/Pb2+ permease
MCACGAALALMVLRFGLSLEKLFSFFLITIALLLAIFVFASVLGWMLGANKKALNLDEHDKIGHGLDQKEQEE